MAPFGKTNAGAIIYRFNGRKLEILLVHQSDKRKTLWSIPKGGVERFEDYETAARREVQEETGIVLGEVEFLGYVDYGKASKRLYCYLGVCPDDATLKKKLPEIDDLQFVEIGQAKRMVEKQQRILIQALQKIFAFGNSKKNSA
jgi:predicted NUDIX family NTP pyrophosphohydrolase